MYTEQDKKDDFQFYVDNFKDLYEKYGRCFLAIKYKTVIGHSGTIAELIKSLPGRDIGSYIIQKCFGDENSYTATISRIRIPGAVS